MKCISVLFLLTIVSLQPAFASVTVLPPVDDMTLASDEYCPTPGEAPLGRGFISYGGGLGGSLSPFDTDTSITIIDRTTFVVTSTGGHLSDIARCDLSAR